MRAGYGMRGDKLATLCWCKRSTVWVPVEDVQAMLTLPCQKETCREMDARERAGKKLQAR